MYNHYLLFSWQSIDDHDDFHLSFSRVSSKRRHNDDHFVDELTHGLPAMVFFFDHRINVACVVGCRSAPH
jgi:hypothetical protein